MASRGPAALVLSLAAAAHASPIDHNDLDEGRPLRIEDAYPVAHGELVLELGAAFDLAEHGPDRLLGTAELIYGALPNLHLEFGGFASTQADDIEGEMRSGDLQLGALYNFNQETLGLPALALKATLNFPTGHGSSGIDAEIKGILTRSFGRVGVHFNAGYEFLSGTSGPEKDGLYHLALGTSVPLGAPRSTRTTVLADIFLDEGELEGQAETLGAEVGLRWQLSARAVLDAGIGTELAGDDRSTLFGTLGVSFSF